MTKAELVADIAIATEKDRKEVLKIIEAFMSCVKEKIVQGEEVHLRGFGSFVIKERATKKARDILNKTIITIPSHKIPVFKPSKQLMEAVKNIENK